MKEPLGLSKLFQIGLVANIIEWYEFLVYMHLSSVISQLFFKPTSKLLSLMQAFAVFAISYLARPLGSLFFGSYADQYGRSASLKISLVMMSVPTIFIGLLPTYQSIGYFSTLLLFILRLVQSFAAGGEFPVTACYVFENTPQSYRSLLLAIVSKSSIVGSALGSLAASTLFLCFSQETIIDWAWRIPFLLGIPLTAWIFYIRKNIVDFPNLSNVNISENSKPITTLLTKELNPFIKGLILCTFSSVVGVYILSTWMPFYLTHFLNYPPTVAHPLNTILLFITIPISLVVAQIARYIGYEQIIKGSLLLSLVLSYPIFKLIQDTSLIYLYISLFVLKAILASLGGVILEALGSLFTHTRSLGMSLAFTLPTAILGGFTPLILTYCIYKTGWLMFPAFYIMMFGLLALPVALSLKTGDGKV